LRSGEAGARGLSGRRRSLRKVRIPSPERRGPSNVSVVGVVGVPGIVELVGDRQRLLALLLRVRVR
jgi:hypothetical protein